jgi:hypothetical protein
VVAGGLEQVDDLRFVELHAALHLVGYLDVPPAEAG